MPDNLDRRWARLHHAYGDASDVPGYLRALVGQDAKAAEAALHELWSCLCHQGTVYSASAAAVPILLEVLEQRTARTARDLLGVAWLVGSIAHGTGYIMVHGPLDPNQPEPEELAEEHRVVHACREAVRKGLPVLFQLLNVEAPSLRASAIYALSRFATEPDVARALAARAREEADENLRIGLRLAQTYATESTSSLPESDGSIFATLMARARSGEVTESQLFTALESVLTEDLEDAKALAREMMSGEAER